MYVALYILMLLVAIGIFYYGTKNLKRSIQFWGISFALLTVLFFWFLNFWGEMLWFEALGYNERFWTVWLTKFLALLIGFLVGGLFIFLLTYHINQGKKWIRNSAVLLGAIVSGFWWFGRWEILLRFSNTVETGIREPILNHDAGFYMFIFPFLDSIFWIFLLLSLIALTTVVISYLTVSQNSNSLRFLPFDPDYPVRLFDSLFISTGILIIVLAYGRYLKRFELLYSEFGVVAGPGWTDDHVRLPLLMVMSILTALFGLSILLPFIRKKLQNIYSSRKRRSEAYVVLASSGILFGIWIFFLGLIPVVFQWLKVEPNEITVEKPYITNNIELTHHGFHLSKIEEREYPATEMFTRETWQENEDLFANARLWDYRALDAVFKQFQEIRLYYEFSDVDIDRYSIDGTYREVMISAREMQTGNLPLQSQTFVNKRFKYTHGYGVVLNKVNEFTEEGLPNLLIKDIPPVSSYESLKIAKPQIYYGELTHDHVVANSDEPEFDYPSGENNVYNSYEGEGGVRLSNLWRKFIYGWKFDGTRFFLSGYPTQESRLMFHRQIQDRIKTLAPFLLLDDDAYVVLDKGRLYWIIDAYTTSDHFPYSEPFTSIERIEYQSDTDDSNIYNRVINQLRGVNYIRNSVKIIIDAYHGSVDFYIYEPEDPVIRVYDKIFPGMFRQKDELSVSLQKHIRYPADMLLIQGLVYTKYHMTDPSVFYNQEDLWVRATEKYYDRVQPVEPYYIMWEQPGSDQMEFVLMLPFTPKNRQVLIGWIAGLCDGDNYGRFLAYKFPKEKRVLGTQQVETKIDQDSFLSGQLTLWDQRGSKVIRGNVLAIPVNETIVYVEPIYLQSETAAYPELRLVTVMHNDRLSYAETFDEALEGLFTGEVIRGDQERPMTLTDTSLRALIEQANQAFEDYLDQMQQKKFDEAARSLQKLENALNQLGERKSTGMEGDE
jgi:uncharacterized membrane protein (UPF0182 family)